MNNIISIITSFVQTGAIAWIVYSIIKGLKIEVNTLGKVVTSQSETIKTMDKRIQETEKIGDLYKKLISDFSKALDDYQAVLTKTKDTTIFELKSTVEEQKITISELKQKTENNNPLQAARAVNISKLFLESENKQLLEFLQKIDNNSDKVFSGIFEQKDFDRLMITLGKQILVSNNIRELMYNEDSIKKLEVIKASYSLNGIGYLITFNNEVYLSELTLNYYRKLYNALG